MSNSRATAAQIISRVLKEKISLKDALSAGVNANINSRDRAFIQELCYGVIRWYAPLRQLCTYLLKKPLNASDQDVYALLLIGLYQLNYLRTSPHAAVHETVQGARELHKVWAVPLINGVLRSFQRQKVSLLKKLPKDSHFAHPDWLIKKLQHAWPNEWQTILAANNHLPPMSLRVNLLKITRKDYVQKLKDKGITGHLSELSATGIILDESCPVIKLPGFMEGEISIQDTAAQLATSLLLLKPGQKVLDACAAPGGKTTHILESQSDLLSCVAVDSDAIRLSKVKDNLNRLSLSDTKVQLLCAKAQNLKSIWKEGLFDRILLDAPCSGTGVIRKHPDIKLLRREEDIGKLAEQQYQLISSLWEILKPDGVLLYVTCSVLPEENSDVLIRFLSHHSDAKEEVLDESWGIACSIGRQIFPKIHGPDGFYYARLRKRLNN
ncbi:16S rRNA (cytosine(967)-C(5))-methyltransferase RsmB [Rickettsiella endosymbiont of Rhagonycha lignosa]|uniref:16S rRNA (cytosine(967)-C(5))-methyltransferase RsmB n=1 Tax=Rickettsiella endosymbiont of Rhagonycha lignosa TaxID=3077937 RepID=UPI00313E1349